MSLMDRHSGRTKRPTSRPPGARGRAGLWHGFATQGAERVLTLSAALLAIVSASVIVSLSGCSLGRPGEGTSATPMNVSAVSTAPPAAASSSASSAPLDPRRRIPTPPARGSSAAL